jgi:hypothetical protein
MNLLLVRYLAFTGFLAAGGVRSSDPVVSLPRNYRLEFENDWVRVIHVHYGPKEILPEHDHPKTPTVYVYLSDAGPVRFKHTGAEPYSLERPAVKQGGFRLNPGVIESHAVENLSNTPSDFLRVELKTLPLHRHTLRGRFPPPSADGISGRSMKTEFEDANIGITRIRVNPGAQPVTVPAVASQRGLNIAVRTGTARLNSGVKTLHSGDCWASSGQEETVQAAGDAAIEILRLELKRPVESR